MTQRVHSSYDGAAVRDQNRDLLAEDSVARSIEAESWVLSTEAGARLLASVAAAGSIRPADVTRLRKIAAPEAVSAAIRMVQAREKAAIKFERGRAMWVDPVAVEQATSEPISRHKAARFQCPLVVDLCAGIGGDTMALAAQSEVISVDVDPGMCRRIQFNSAIYGVSERILAVRSPAETFVVPAQAWLHLDPDRRLLHPRRAVLLEDYAPGPDFWKAAFGRVRAGALKLSPAADFASHFSGPEHEVELISLRGECKEATVWFGDLVSCRRRATRLPENVTWTDRDGAIGDRVAVSPLLNVLFDPDPALLRAGLLDGFARAHHLLRVEEEVDYLTGEHAVETPFLTPFFVREESPLDLKRLTRLIEKHDVGPLEIKVRGANVLPESLRKQLKPRGNKAATLLVFGGDAGVRAVLAERRTRAVASGLHIPH
jgi:THUMP domain-like/RNA cap guanine-N2 methyltransferase